MTYTNYTESVEAIEGLAFVRLSNLQNVLQQLDGIQFALQTQRTQGIQILAGVEKEFDIFGESVRFPKVDPNTNKTIKFVCVQLKDWPMKFDQVMSSLNYKTPDIAGTDKDLALGNSNYQASFTNNKKTGSPSNGSPDDNAEHCITSQSERKVFLNALKSFTTGVADMKQQLNESILTRRIFERKFSLIWEGSETK